MQQKVKDQFIRRVIDYYATLGTAAEIQHTQSVANYTRLIADADNRDPHQTDLLELAAWLHDIGCPASRRIYGNSRPENQQHEGRLIVNEWLKDINWLTSDEKIWLANVVGTHHQFQSAVEYRFEPLFEADLIVNMTEGYYKAEKAEHLYEKLMVTTYGKELYKQLFLKKCDNDSSQPQFSSIPTIKK